MGHELLAGPALARDHHGDVARRDLAYDLEDFLHHRRGADDPLLVILGVDGRLVLGDRAQVGVGLERVLGQGQHPLGIERLHDIVERAEFHRLDGGLRRSERRHKDDELFRVDRSDVLERLEPAHAGHPDVEKNEVRLRPLLDHGDPLLPVRRLGDQVAAGG